jgi:serine/threonine protein phosphatase PrpC
MAEDHRDLPLTTLSASTDPADHAHQDVVVRVDTSGLSDRGLRRAGNEDHFLVAQIDRTWRTLQTNMPADALPSSVTDSVTAQIVADGMGGAVGGAVASRTAIATFVDIVLRTPNLILRLDKQNSQHVLTRMAARFEQMKQALEDVARLDPALSGMGTTMTLAVNFRADLLVAHVGDSRAYLLRQGHLERLTRDQTMVQSLLEKGAISPEEMVGHPMRHVLTGVLGTKGKPIDVELRFIGLEDGDQVLVCSDGLTEMVAESAIADALVAAPTAEAACRRLVELANSHGGKDNVTAVVSRYQITPLVG